MSDFKSLNQQNIMFKAKDTMHIQDMDYPL